MPLHRRLGRRRVRAAGILRHPGEFILIIPVTPVRAIRVLTSSPVLFILQRMDWTGETSWISETSWRAGSIALAGGVCLGLALVHYTDPGVIKPNPHGVDPAVAEDLSMGRPVCEFLFI